LLQQFKRNEVTQTEALAIIREAVACRDEVKRTMRPVFGESYCTFDEFTLRLRAGWANARFRGGKGTPLRAVQWFRHVMAVH
jgi:hypothetical protein